MTVSNTGSKTAKDFRYCVRYAFYSDLDEWHGYPDCDPMLSFMDWMYWKKSVGALSSGDSFDIVGFEDRDVSPDGPLIVERGIRSHYFVGWVEYTDSDGAKCYVSFCQQFIAEHRISRCLVPGKEWLNTGEVCQQTNGSE